MKIITIETDGKCNLIDKDWSLLDYNAFVDGWIESLTFPNGCSLIINSDGKLIGFDLNTRASLLSEYLFSPDSFDDYIAGNAILVGPTDENGNTTSVTEDVIQFFINMKWLENDGL